MTIGHAAGFTWDGRVLIFGHEPGGGGQARCQATSSITDRSLFFVDARSGADLGSFVAVGGIPPTAQRAPLAAGGSEVGEPLGSDNP